MGLKVLNLYTLEIPVNRFFFISILFLNGWFSCTIAQEDSLFYFKDKHEFSILFNQSAGNNSLTQHGEIMLASQQSSYFGLNYRIGLIHTKPLNVKLSMGLDLWSLKQNVAYTYFVTGVTSTHSPQLRSIVLNIAVQFNYKVVDRKNRSFGFDVFPGTEVSLLNYTNLSIVHSDYTDPSLGFEVGRFQLQNQSIVYPSLHIHFWSLVHMGNYGIKPFLGVKFTRPKTSTSFIYPNGNIIKYNYHGARSFLNLGIALVF